MEKILLSEINIIPIKPQNGLLAFASAVINNQFYISNIAIFSSPTEPSGYRIQYPDKILANGKRVHCFHPITKEAGEVVSKAIVSKYEELVKNFNHIQ